MAKYSPGTNRERVYSLLTATPQTAQSIADTLGLPRKAVESVLNQIKALGDAAIAYRDKNGHGFIRGDGIALHSSSNAKSGGKKTPHDRFDTFIAKHIGKEFKSADIKALGLSGTFVHGKIKAAIESGLVQVVPNSSPRRYIGSSSGPQQTELIPKPSPKQQLMPSMEAPMQTSDAIGHFMQVESQNMIYRQALQQILAVYEQLGNVLEMAGLLEEE